MKIIFEKVMPPKTGLAVEVKQGQHLRVITLEGPQVVDMALFNLNNLRETLSLSYSRTRYFPKPGQGYVPRDHMEEGDWLMSTLCRPMMTIVKETPRPKNIHKTINRMCNNFLYEAQLQVGPRDGCHETISKAVAPYGVLPEDIPDTFDIFMNYPHNCQKGYFEILAPVAKPGDYIEFVADINCLVGFSNCPLDIGQCNGGRCKPVQIEIYEDEDFKPKPILSAKEWLAEELKRRGIKQAKKK